MNKAYDKTLGNIEFKSSLFLNKFDVLSESSDTQNTSPNKYHKFTNTLQFVQIINAISNDAEWLLRKVLKRESIMDEIKNWQTMIYKSHDETTNVSRFNLQTYSDLHIAISNLPNAVLIFEHNYDKNTSDTIKKWYQYTDTNIGTFRSEIEVKKALKEHGYTEVSSVNIHNPLGIWISQFTKT